MVDTEHFQSAFMQQMLDHEPDKRNDGYQAPSARYRAYKNSVMLDLENLLNNRSRLDSSDAFEDDELLLSYGVTDFAHINISALSGREALRRKIQDAIRTNEPRLSDIRVALLDKQSDPNRLGFRIEARLHVYTDAEPVIISASFEPARKVFNFQSESR
ncbi:type VI secretion system baseplate subunit TssE [Neptunomonas sp.]|uniref:type VI secretion system baseplate subunit TssE n=1 Tax=Neptunomonas sp. TaxID=1971898 RepID=UPI0025D5BBFA|nr:type VI secretion system baseplate subunit TssE [Neptunomonas sp.]